MHESIDTKTCTACGETKPVDEFHRDRQKADGRRPRCAVCSRADVKAIADRNRSRAVIPQTVSEQTCSTCGVVKPRAAFSPDLGRLVGIESRCKTCIARDSRARYAARRR